LWAVSGVFEQLMQAMIDADRGGFAMIILVYCSGW
jgi:hypothetical protein